MNPPQNFALRGEHITLDALLKATGLTPSGGAAKMLIAEGAARVNGETETRRSRGICLTYSQRLSSGSQHP